MNGLWSCSFISFFYTPYTACSPASLVNVVVSCSLIFLLLIINRSHLFCYFLLGQLRWQIVHTIPIISEPSDSSIVVVGHVTFRPSLSYFL
jgi:hypothetical protein